MSAQETRRTDKRPGPTVAAEGPRSPARPEPTDEEIRSRAYEIFVERGRAHGRDEDDWLEAERELREAAEGSGESSAPRPRQDPALGSDDALK